MEHGYQPWVKTSKGIILVLGPGLSHEEGKNCLLGLETTLPNRDYFLILSNLLGTFITNSTGWLPVIVKGMIVQWL